MHVEPQFKNFLLGCDPEVFIVNAEGKIVSAHDLLPGTKRKPHKVPGGAIQVDGVAGEFNIDPAASFEEWNDRIVMVWEALNKELPPGYSSVAVASTKFSKEDWATVPARARALGCEPDFNAWTGRTNAKVKPEDGFRTCGGHVHYGWRDPSLDIDAGHHRAAINFVRHLDWHLGAWSVLMDKDVERRSLYGAAGCHRLKKYGVEYRTLSNFWIATEELRLEVWNRSMRAAASLIENPFGDRSKDDLIRSINESDTETASALVAEIPNAL